MRSVFKVIAILAVLGLFCTSAGWANQAKPAPAKETPKAAKETPKAAKEEKKPAVKTHQATGEVVSTNDKEVVLTKVRGKEGNVTFALTGDTKKSGEFKPGSKVVVIYHEEAGKMIARSVKVKETKATKGEEKKEEKKEAKPEAKKPPKKPA